MHLADSRTDTLQIRACVYDVYSRNLPLFERITINYHLSLPAGEHGPAG